MKKRTPTMKKQAERLNELSAKLRKKISTKRKQESRIVATLEVAHEILSDRKFWVQGSWFDGATQGNHIGGVITDDGELLAPGSDYEQLVSCDVEDKVCRMCAEGAILFAADSIFDGNEAIKALNQTSFVREQGGSIMEINDGRTKASKSPKTKKGQKDAAYKTTLRAFEEGIAELKKEYKIK